MEEPYGSLWRSQVDTWDSTFDGVRTAYYHGRNGVRDDGATTWRTMIRANCTDAYYLMAGKFKLALDVLLRDPSWEVMFRTNSSSYVNKQNLISFVDELPKEKLYAGWTMNDTNDDGGLCVSGAGIFLSRDACEILAREIDGEKLIEEDVYIGRILRRHGFEAIDDKSRVDYPDDMNRWMSAYHIRFKTADRIRDAHDMRVFHELKLSE